MVNHIVARENNFGKLKNPKESNRCWLIVRIQCINMRWLNNFLLKIKNSNDKTKKKCNYNENTEVSAIRKFWELVPNPIWWNQKVTLERFRSIVCKFQAQCTYQLEKAILFREKRRGNKIPTHSTEKPIRTPFLHMVHGQLCFILAVGKCFIPR